MKIVIEIGDLLYNEIVKQIKPAIYDSFKFSQHMIEAIRKSTPLPEHHGRLIDYDDLIEKLDRYGRKSVKYQLPYSPTIIEADKESE